MHDLSIFTLFLEHMFFVIFSSRFSPPPFSVFRHFFVIVVRHFFFVMLFPSFFFAPCFESAGPKYVSVAQLPEKVCLGCAASKSVPGGFTES